MTKHTVEADKLREKIRCIVGECFHCGYTDCLYNDPEGLPSYHKSDQIMELTTQATELAKIEARMDQVKKIPDYGLKKPFDYECNDLNHSFNSCVSCYKQMKISELAQQKKELKESK